MKKLLLFALLFFTLAISTRALALAYIDPPERAVSKRKTVVAPPTVATLEVTNIGNKSVTFNAALTDNGGDAATTIGIVWSTSSNPVKGGGAFEVLLPAGPQSTVARPAVSPGTTIYYKAFAQNSIGEVGYGVERTFQLGAPLLPHDELIQPKCVTVGAQASVAPTGGLAPYTYLWSNISNASTAILYGGNWTCTITDAEGTVLIVPFEVIPPPAITVTPSQKDACFNSANGSATVAATGGTGGYTYLWSNGATTATATGLAPGSYSCTIKDAKTCPYIQSFTIGEATSAIALTPSSQVNVTCNGQADASATVTATGGAGSYTYDWSPSGGNSAAASGLTAGNYTVTVTDANGCTKTLVFNITEPTAITTSGTQTNVTCKGSATGSATVTASGGAGSYTYSWFPSGGTAATATGLTAGTYTVTITDANSCSTTRVFPITESTTVLASSSAHTNVSCNGSASGSATVTATGGAGGYTYRWSPSGGTAATATGLMAGTYTCTITDASGCSKAETLTIIEPSLIVTSGTQTNVSCNGGTNGTATVTATGGFGTYSYSWSPSGGTAATASGLTAGTYTVTVTDANSCSKQQTFTITEPVILASTGSQTNVSCNGGSNASATVTATGGTGTYWYSWSPSGGTAATASGLTAGAYTCTITDANDCSTQQHFTISQPSVIVPSGTQVDVSCNGGSNGSATMTATGGTGTYSYSWSPAGGTAATASGLTAGTYRCIITDANGCSQLKSFTIMEPTAIVTSGTQVNLSCNGGANGSATVTATGGTGAYSYSWSPSGGTAATASGLTAGVYTVTVTDANVCSKQQIFVITQPSAITTSGTQTNVSCNGGTNASATVTATGGTGTYSYSWSPSGGTAATASGLTAGVYTVTVTDANGCTKPQAFTITEPTAIIPSGTQVNVSTFLGADGSATAIATGGAGAYTYSWSPTGGSGATASGLTAGSYTCYITDANGCTTNKTFILTQPVVMTGFSNLSKSYGDLAFSLTQPNSASTGAFSYSSNDNTVASISGTTVTILKPGTVTITATQAADANYNISTIKATLTIAKKNISFALNQAPTISKTYDGNDTAPLAAGNSMLVGLIGTDQVSTSFSAKYADKNAGTGKTITANNIVLTGAQKDYYNLTTTTATVTGSITTKTLTATAAAVTKVYDGTNAATIAFNPISGQITGENVSPGYTSATYNDKNVGSNKAITVNGLALTGTDKNNYSITFSTTGAITLKPLTITADNLDKFAATANPTFTASYTGFVTGESNSVLTSQPQLTTLAVLNSPIGTYDINVAGATAANYSISYVKGTLTIKPGAPKSIAFAGVTLFEYSPIGTNAGTLTSTSDDPMAMFTYKLVPGAGDIDNASFNIVGNNIQTARSLSTITKTNYNVLVRSMTQHGLSLDKVFTINLSAVSAKATNIMSPNGDGVNDKWIIDDLALYPNNEVKIFDKTGRAIYSKKGYDNSWEGTLNGAPLAEGTYFYVIDFGPGKPKTKGYITITKSN